MLRIYVAILCAVVTVHVFQRDGVAAGVLTAMTTALAQAAADAIGTLASRVRGRAVDKGGAR